MRPLENSLGAAEGGWPRISEMGSKAGEQVGLVWDRGKRNRREKFPGPSQSRAVHEVRRATLQITLNGSTGGFSTQRSGLDWARSAPFRWR